MASKPYDMGNLAVMAIIMPGAWLQLAEIAKSIIITEQSKQATNVIGISLAGWWKIQWNKIEQHSLRRLWGANILFYYLPEKKIFQLKVSNLIQ
jgi:hypothetical protein